MHSQANTIPIQHEKYLNQIALNMLSNKMVKMY